MKKRKASPASVSPRLVINKIAAGIFTATMMYFIIAGSSGVLIWILSYFKIFYQDGPWISAKYGWEWLLILHYLIQQPRYFYMALWHAHPIITSIISYIIGTIVVLAMNYSDKDTEESEEKLLERINKALKHRRSRGRVEE